jgi:hypothetical protein
MDNTGLIFIPDISGFTKFVTETELEHSRYIIEELLEAIINSNELGLNISEIEGDAILFTSSVIRPGFSSWPGRLKRCFADFINTSSIMNTAGCASVWPAKGP